MRSSAWAVLACLCAGALHAAPELRAVDRDRIARFDEAAGEALLAAYRAGSADDIAALSDALDGRPVVPNPSGDWNCRTIKAGGPVGLVAYTPFRCRITLVSATEWRFEKLTGSQLTRGTIAFDEGRAIYRGVGYVEGGPAVEYEALPPELDPVEPGQTTGDVAVFEQVSPTEARLMFPFPVLESRFDILHLTR